MIVSYILCIFLCLTKINGQQQFEEPGEAENDYDIFIVDEDKNVIKPIPKDDKEEKR